MEFSQLEYYIALCKYGSYTRASEELNISQPAISAAIKKLADECNDPLVIKKKGQFSLTSKGEVLLKGAVTIHNDMEKLQEELEAFSLREREIIRLALPFPLCPELLEEQIPRFSSVHTDTAMHLLQEGHRQIVSGLKSKNIDLGIVCRDYLDDDLGFAPYKKLEYYACFPPKHRFAGAKAIAPDMFKEEIILIPRIANSISGALQEYFSHYDIKPEFKYVDSFPADVWALAEKGEGIAFMPVNAEQKGSRPLSPPLYSELFVVWLKNQPLTAHKQELISYLCKEEEK